MDMVDGKRVWNCASDVIVEGVAARASSLTPACVRSLAYDVIGASVPGGPRLGANRRVRSSAKSTRLSMTGERGGGSGGGEAAGG